MNREFRGENIRFCVASVFHAPFVHAAVIYGILGTQAYSLEVKNKELSYNTLESIKECILSGLCVIALDDNEEIVGVCMGEYEDGPIWLNWIVVDDRWHGVGVGNELLRMFLQVGKEHGNKVCCSSLIDNHASAGLLNKHGFDHRGVYKKHWHGLDFDMWEKFL